MTLITYRKTNDNMVDRYNHIFNNHVNYPYGYNNTSDKRLDVEIIENKKSIDILADLPGIEKKNIDINIKNNLIEISAEITETDTRNNDEFYHYNERSKNGYYRSFKLTDNIDKDSIKAKFRNGELTIQLPKIKDAISIDKKITIS